MIPLIAPMNVEPVNNLFPVLLAIVLVAIIGGTGLFIVLSLRKKSKAAQAEWEQRMRENGDTPPS